MLQTDGRLKLARNAKSYDDGAKGKKTNKQTEGQGKRKRQREGKGKRDEDRGGEKRGGRRDGRGGQLPPVWFYVTASPV